MDKKILKKEISLLEAADYAATNKLHLKEDNEYYYFIEDWEDVTDGEIVDNKEKETEIARAKKLRELAEYDNSEAVNSFTYQGEKMWKDKDTRRDALQGIEAEIAKGAETSYLGNGIELQPAQAKEFILDIEYYAKLCWANTDKHKVAICALKTKEEIGNYDFTIGYPQKIEFK